MAVPPKLASRKMRLSIVQAVCLSLAMHIAAAAPLVYLFFDQQPDDAPETLTVDLDGLVSDRQENEKKADDAAPAPQAPVETASPPAEAAQSQPPIPSAPPSQEPEAPDEPSDAPPPSPAASQQRARSASDTAAGPVAAKAEALPVADDARAARTIARRQQQDEDAMQKYAVRLVKRVRAGLIYPPAEGAAKSQGVVKVSFDIHADGSIDPASLKVIASSGRAGLDAAALATIRKSAPYPPPPQAATVAFSLYFGKRQ
jgi:protein TonB